MRRRRKGAVSTAPSICNFHFHKPGSICIGVNSTPAGRTEAALIEGDADPLSLRQMTWQGWRELFAMSVKCSGMPSGPGDIQRCPGIRQIADRAIDRAVVELDRSGLQDAMSWGSPLLVHEILIRPNPGTGRNRPQIQNRPLGIEIRTLRLEPFPCGRLVLTRIGFFQCGGRPR